METIRVDGLTKTYRAKQKDAGFLGSIKSLWNPKFREIEAVRDISFSVEKGQMLAFIGPNGAGKSTTIKMLTGILHPSNGDLRVLGLVPWQARQQLAHRIGTVFGQKSQLWYHLPPVDSFRLLGSIYELDATTLTRRINELIKLFELDELCYTPVRKMSLGQRMRCEIAAAVLHRPQVLFLDEPTIGLDVVAKLAMREFIKRINAEDGVTVFLTSHDAGDIEQLCKRVIVINNGQLILDVPTSTLKHNYLNSKLISIRLTNPVEQMDLPGTRIIKHSERGIKLAVDTSRVSLETILGSIFERASVSDITITDPSMEQIIGKIYQKGAESHAKVG